MDEYDQPTNHCIAKRYDQGHVPAGRVGKGSELVGL